MTIAVAAKSRLREPGLLRWEPGTERYRVRGGGATVLTLNAGDRVTITDVEGRQPCELVAFSPDGHPDAEALGGRAQVNATGLATVLANGGGDAPAVSAALPQAMNPDGARAVRLLDGDTRPGDVESFTVERDVICAIIAPG